MNSCVYDECEAKVRYETLKEDVTEHKEEIRLLNIKIDGVSKLLIGGFSGTIFTIIGGIILFILTK